MAERVDLDGEPDIQPFADAQLDQTIDQLLSVAIAGKIVVGDKKALDALGDVLPH